MRGRSTILSLNSLISSKINIEEVGVCVPMEKAVAVEVVVRLADLVCDFVLDSV